MAQSRLTWTQRLLPLVGAAAIALLTPESLADDVAGAPAPAGGIRRLASTHLTLYTDLPSGGEIDALPGYFDQAFVQWCDYFGVDAKQHGDWRAQCCLIAVPDRFQTAGLTPADLPKFRTGYTRGENFWMYDQTSVYYRRHLLLHEGTHAFMYSLLGDGYPPWYFEGVAELMATHRLDSGKLSLNYFPRGRDEVPGLGRIEIVERGYAARRAMSLTKIFAYDQRAHSQNEPYGWCWAAAAFLDGNPRYRARFRELASPVGNDDFAERVTRLSGADAARMNEDWQLFVANLDYGYDFERMAVEYAAGQPLAADAQRVSVAADRGWQSSGMQLEAGRKYRLRASGRYQIAKEPRVWTCEPGGVTIRYYHGQPLGILLAAVRPDDADPGRPSGLLKPIVVGLETVLHFESSGTLYLRINDSAGSLADNAGSLSVEVTPE
jgi:hypothetical protein